MIDMEEKYVIDDDFIGQFDNFFSDEYINLVYNNALSFEQNGILKSRSVYHIPNTLLIDDKANSFSLEIDTKKVDSNFYEISMRIGSEFYSTFWDKIWPLYTQKNYILSEVSNGFYISDVKMQATRPGQGYHAWHCENVSKDSSKRVLAYTLYLNTVDEGGETEFLHQKKRIKARKNTFALWPAHFTHIHRGNPPLSNNKYILTGWIEYN